MKDFEEMVLAGIRRKYVSDICEALQKQTPLELYDPPPVLKLSLAAEARVLWQKEQPHLLIEARGFHNEKNKLIGHRSIYSTQSIKTIDDAHRVTDYAIEKMRYELVQAFLAVIDERRRKS